MKKDIPDHIVSICPKRTTLWSLHQDWHWILSPSFAWLLLTCCVPLRSTRFINVIVCVVVVLGLSAT